jgi:hypothetical protein
MEYHFAEAVSSETRAIAGGYATSRYLSRKRSSSVLMSPPMTEISWIRGRVLMANVASERTTMPRIVKANPRKYRDSELSHWGFSPVPVRGLPITLHAAMTLCTRVSK